MRTLTKSQNEILNDLQNEFARINEQNNSAGMFEVFSRITDLKKQDDIRIEEIVKINEIIKITRTEQVKSDLETLVPEVAKIGIEIVLYNPEFFPRIVLSNGNKEIKIYYNLSQKTIKLNINNIDQSIGFYLTINDSQVEYKDLRSLLESERFEEKLKYLLQ
jgi:hypothetical protein